jgi:hypothetical protein
MSAPDRGGRMAEADMENAAPNRPHSEPSEKRLFPIVERTPASLASDVDSLSPGKQRAGRPSQEDVRAIQDLIWKEALFAVRAAEPFAEEAAFRRHLQTQLPQNSPETRERYTQTLLRWFFPDGMQGLAAEVWRHYHNASLAEQILRYLYLRAETMAGAAVTEALFPIAEDSLLPAGYLPNFVRSRFGATTPDKSLQRLKSNLRKLGFLTRARGERDVLRPLTPSGTAFLILLHHLFARQQAGSVEFRTLAADPFWKYLGFKSEDRLRDVLKAAVNRDLLAKYVLADRIESISFRHTFAEFVGKGTVL